MVQIKKRILYFALPLFLTSHLPSHRNPENFLEQPYGSSQQSSIRFACNNGAIGISVETANRLDIYGFSTSEGFKRISGYKDEQGRLILESGL